MAGLYMIFNYISLGLRICALTLAVACMIKYLRKWCGRIISYITGTLLQSFDGFEHGIVIEESEFNKEDMYLGELCILK